jgi:hypothetical protein
MAHITTATEFCNNQSAAIILDKNISIQYNLSHIESFFTFNATNSFLSFSSDKNSILLKKLLTFSSLVSSCLIHVTFLADSSFFRISLTHCFISFFSAFVRSSFTKGISFNSFSIIKYFKYYIKSLYHINKYKTKINQAKIFAIYTKIS